MIRERTATDRQLPHPVFLGSLQPAEAKVRQSAQQSISAERFSAVRQTSKFCEQVENPSWQRPIQLEETAQLGRSIVGYERVISTDRIRWSILEGGRQACGSWCGPRKTRSSCILSRATTIARTRGPGCDHTRTGSWIWKKQSSGFGIADNLVVILSPCYNSNCESA